MMPQQHEEVRSEQDLGFMTEVDAEYKGKTFQMGKESQNTAEVVSTRYSEVDQTSAPRMSTQMLEAEKAEFKQVIKELISKEQSDQLQMEERILEKMRKRALSKGWDKPSGVKVAPLKILQSLQ